MAKAAIMIMGTNSNAGKSLLVAGLCRYFTQKGIIIRPFKPQNMSNNAAAISTGGEIGRAQFLQARACKTAPSVDMNPVLLKPETDRRSQLIVHGRAMGHIQAKDFGQQKPYLLRQALTSFQRLGQNCDFILAEGAGSPAEINLRKGDIANMGFAVAANIPAILVGDIDRGGVIASIIGTYVVLPQKEKQRIRGFIINKFRGDPKLFANGVSAIEQQTGWVCLGIVPWFAPACRLPGEDILDLPQKQSFIAPGEQNRQIKIAIPILPRIANFDDFDPLQSDPRLAVTYIRPGQALPGDADWVILPGSKAVMSDLAFFLAEDWHIDLRAHIRRGGKVLGICGGYQMLGQKIIDMEGLEGVGGEMPGLGLLDVVTRLENSKTTRQASGVHIASNHPLRGYEIHLGVTSGADCARPLFTVFGRAHGAISPDGKISGCYLHGLFSADSFRAAYFATDIRNGEDFCYEQQVEETLDELAAHLATHLDLAKLHGIACL